MNDWASGRENYQVISLGTNLNLFKGTGYQFYMGGGLQLRDTVYLKRKLFFIFSVNFRT